MAGSLRLHKTTYGDPPDPFFPYPVTPIQKKESGLGMRLLPFTVDTVELPATELVTSELSTGLEELYLLHNGSADLLLYKEIEESRVKSAETTNACYHRDVDESREIS